LPQKDKGSHSLHQPTAELHGCLPGRARAGEPPHLSSRAGLVARRTPHQGTPGVQPRSRESLGLRRVAGMRRRSSHTDRPFAQHQRLLATARSGSQSEPPRRPLLDHRQSLEPQESTHQRVAGEPSEGEAGLHPSRSVLAQPPRSVVATVSTRSLRRTELRRCGGDRAGHEGSYQATQPSFKTLGVGSSTEATPTSAALFCVPPLRNGALGNFGE
jgi:hypothetical protein